MPDDAPPSAPSTALALTPTEQQERRATAIAKYNGKIPNSCRFYCEACGWDGTLEFDDAELAALGHDPESYTGPCPGKPATPPTADGPGAPAVECGFHMLLPYRLVTQGHEALMDASQRQRREDVEMATDVALDRIAQRVAPMLAGRSAPASTVAEPTVTQVSQLPAEARSAQIMAIQSTAQEAASQISSSDIATYKNIVMDAAAEHGVALTAAEVHSIATELMEANNA